ncbi:hypothetical protein V493_01577 [Pseudogymnoascus sp. VKM F-4281 (FW-2241)]|nr:hypothetical protein V493_01577 [Pseudogymnoascus sp. VKM F-4281 (FW-2241)]
MAPSTPTLEERQSQVIAEDCSTGSTDSDFDELFSQNTMHMAASGDSHWRAADWHSFDDPLRPELSEGPLRPNDRGSRVHTELSVIQEFEQVFNDGKQE